MNSFVAKGVSMECAGPAALWPVATCRNDVAVETFNNNDARYRSVAPGRHGPKRRQTAALQGGPSSALGL